MKPIVKSLAPAPLLLGVWLLGGSSCLGQDPTVGVPIHTWDRQFGLGRLQGAVASLDGTYLATFGARGGVLRFATNGALVRILPGLTDWIESAAFSVDGSILATAGDDGLARLWSVPDGTLRQTFSGHAGVVWSVAISRDGAQLLTGSADGTAKLWSVASGYVLRTFRGHSNEVWSVAFSPDGTQVLTCSADKTAKVWSADTGALLFTCTGHAGQVSSVVFSPDGTRLLTGSWDDTAALWSASTGARLREFKGHRDDVDSVAFSADGLKVLTASWDATAVLWAADTGAVLQTFTGHSNGLWMASFASGTEVLTAGADQTARFWDATTGSNSLTIRGHSDGIWSIAFSPDGTKVLTGGWDKTATLWNRASGAVLQTFQGHADDVQSVAFSPDGTKILTGSWDNTAKLWQTNGALLRTFAGHTEGVWSVAFSPDGAKVLTGSADNTLKLWSATDASLVRTLTGHSNEVMSVAFSADGRTVLSGSADATARLWQTNGTVVKTFSGHTHYVRSVAFSPDGGHVLTGSWDGMAKLWQTNGTLERNFAGHTDGLWSAAFSPDGLQVLTGSADGTAKLWSLEDGAVLRTLLGHTRDVTDVAFSTNGAWLLTGSWDGTALLWSANAGAAVTLLTASPMPPATVNQPYSVIMQAAGGTAPYSWSVISGSLPAGLSLTLSSGRILGTPSLIGSNQFTVRVVDASGLAATNSYQLMAQGTTLAFTSQPHSVVVKAGDPASFSVAVSGEAPLFYQWFFNTGMLAGQTSAVVSLPSVQPGQDGSYQVIVSNRYAAITSQVATLSIVVPPHLTVQPQDQSVPAGQDTTLSVTATGGWLSYQWRCNETNLPGATGATLTLTDVQAANAGRYTVVVTNLAGSETSAVATLTVTMVWQHQDIGSVGLPGSFSQSNGVFALTGSGGDIWDTADGFHFVYTSWTGDGSVVARVTGLDPVDVWSKAGVMIRESLAPDSRNAMMLLSAASGTSFQRRLATGASSFSTSGNDMSQRPPCWVKLVRSGDLVAAFKSTDGTTWVLVGSDTVPMSSAVKVGLAVTAHNNTNLCAATFDHVQVSAAEPPALIAQPRGQTYAAGATVSLSAVAVGASPLSYQWRCNNTNLPSGTNASLTLSNAQPGQSGLYTVVVTNLFGSAASQGALISVIAGGVSVWGDFNNGLPAGLTPIGGAGVDSSGGVGGSGVLKLTLNASNQFGGVLLTNFAANLWVDRFVSYFKVYLSDGSSDPAEGFSFNFAADLPTGGAFVAESGAGSGLSVCFHIYGNDYLEVKYRGATVGLAAVPLYGLGVFVDVGIELSPGGLLNVFFSGQPVLTNLVLPEFAPARGRFGIYARTDANYANQWLDDLSISAWPTLQPVVITYQPPSRSVAVGSSSTLQVGASGVPTLFIQWRCNGTNLLGKTNSILSLSSIQVSQAGLYCAVVTNASGAATSQVATVVVHPPVTNAGTLHVELLATDPSASLAIWTNRGDLGHFTRNGQPQWVPNVLGTGVPGLLLRPGDYFVGPLPGSDLDGSSDRSVEVWVLNPDVAPEKAMVAWGRRGTAHRNWVQSYGSSPFYGAGATWNDDPNWPSPQAVPAPARWHHLVMTYDGGSNVRCYVDGGLVIDQTLWGVLDTFPDNSLLIGGQWETNGTQVVIPFTGYLNAVRIHGGPMSSAQVASNYAAGPWSLPTDVFNAPPVHGAVCQFFPDATGVLLQNLPGDLDFMQDTPPATSYLTNFLETDQNRADYYGERIMALITPPQSGAYTFWISSDDDSHLYLSGSEDPAGKSLIASMRGASGFRNWSAQTSQQSAAIQLTAGQRYYLEILHADGWGNDYVSVRWQLPDGTREEPIPASRLTPVHPPLFHAVTQGVYCEIYEGFTGWNLPDFTNQVLYLNHQFSRARFLPAGFDFQSAGVWYGQRMQALFLPPATGNYTFSIASDDQSTLSLSADGDPNHRQPIAWLPVGGWTGYRSWTNFPTQVSTPIALQAGQPCYLEVLHKQGSGDDHVTVRVQLPDGTLEEPIRPSRMLPYSPPVIAQQPQGQTAPAGSTATLTTLVSGLSPMSYQWRRNGSLINGATNAVLVLPNLSTAATGDYTVVITNALGLATSAVAVLTVTNSVAAPLPSGCVAWWRAENNFLDSVGTNHGIGLGAMSFASGEVGQAFTSGGAGAGVLLGNPGSLQLQTLTIEGWVKRSSATQSSFENHGGAELFAYGSGGYAFGIADNGALFLSKAGVDQIVSGVAITDTAYHHVAVTKSASTVVFYVDAVADPVRTYTSTFSFSTPVVIGTWREGSTATFMGQIDEVAIYNRALASNEVAAIYAAGSAGKAGGTSALSFTTAVSGSPFSAAGYSFGWQFTASAPLRVTALGCFDHGGDGLAEPHLVTIWDSAGNLVCQATASTTDPLQDSFRYTTNLTGTTLLNPGTYTIAAYYPSTSDLMVFSANQSVFSTAAAVTYIEGRYGSGAASAPADHYEPQDEGYFGPNFQFIPGPAFTAPTITGQPQGQTNAVGATASFTVTATGATPLAYQWYKSVAGGPWSVISGATNSTFSLQPLALSDAGDYTVVVTNNYGTTNSAAARLTVTSAAPGATVIFNNFSDASSLQLNGTATNTLTTDGWVLHLTAATNNQAGSAFLKNTVTLGSNAAFSTFFSFRLSQGGGYSPDVDGVQGADGIVFVVQTVANNVGSTGGGLGYAGIPNSVGIEFDTWYNTGDPAVDPSLPGGQTNANGSIGDGNHIGIDLNGAINSISTIHIAPPFNDGQIGYAWVDYDGASQTLEVRVSRTSARPAQPVLSAHVNLLDHLGTSAAYVGFTGATGGSWNEQDILSWQLKTSYQPLGITFLHQPQSQTTFVGSNVTFWVSATGDGPLTYQWRFKNADLHDSAHVTGTASTNLAILNAQLADTGEYTVVVSDSYGSVITAKPVLTVLPPDTTPPVISQVVASPGLTNCDIAWRTDEPATTVVAYGLTLGYGFTNQFTAFLQTNHLLSLAGLNPGTTYFFQVRSADAADNSAVLGGTNLVFSTAPAADLTVSNLIISAVPAFQAGALVTLQWQDANRGGATVSRSFQERIQVLNTSTGESLVDAIQTYDPLAPGLAPLGPGQTQTRSYSFTLPDGARGAGSVTMTITVDSANDIFEFNSSGTGESNNTASVTRASVLPAYPDLVVTNVISPATGLPGGTLTVNWTVRNLGNTNATGVWSEGLTLVSLGSTNPGVLTGRPPIPLGSFTFTNNLAPGASLIRTQTVQVPIFASGNYSLSVYVDTADEILESNEMNNSAEAAQILTLTPALTLTLSQETVAENAGTNAFTATLTRTPASSNALVVSLGNAAAPKLIVPPSVTLPAGQASVLFPVGVLDNIWVDGDQVQLLTAESSGYQSAQAQVTVLDNDVPALTLTFSTNQVSEAAPSPATLGQVWVNSLLATDLVVSLWSDSPTRATVPSTIVVSAGQSSVTFPVQAVNNSVADGTWSGRIQASAPAFGTASARLTVLDDEFVQLSLTLQDAMVREGGTSPATYGTVTRAQVRPFRQTVLLGQNPQRVGLPLLVEIGPGEAGVSFPITVSDDLVNSGLQEVTISAWPEGASANQVAAILMVLDNDGPTLQLSLASDAVAEGQSVTATVRRNAVAGTNLVVSLNSSTTGQITLPASVTIPAGLTSVEFAIAAVADGVIEGAHWADVWARSAGFNPGRVTLALSDGILPDLKVTGIGIATNGYTDSSIIVSWAVANQGQVAAPGSWVDRVLLSDDAFVGGDFGQLRVRAYGPLAPGQTYTNSGSFLLPSKPGRYWVVLQTDADGNVAEGSEGNNSDMAAWPLDVAPAYQAIVQPEVALTNAGSPIRLTGRAWFSASGQSAALKSVTVRIRHDSFRQVLQARTDTNGNFVVWYQPLGLEVGVFTVGAAHPDVTEDPEQGMFFVLGLEANPAGLSYTLVPQTPVSGVIVLSNRSELTVNGLTAELVQAGGYLESALLLSTNQLGAGEATTLSYTLQTTNLVRTRASAYLRVRSAENLIVADIPLDLELAPLRPQLFANPAYLERGMVRGTQAVVSCEIRNIGGADATNLRWILPDFAWLKPLSATNLGTLAPGGRVVLTLGLTPSADLPLTRYSGNLAVVGDNDGVSIPFQFRALSEALGEVLVSATDEMTYYAPGAPRVTNALIRLVDAFSGATIHRGYTDTNGQVLFTNVAEGPYTLEASAIKHSSQRTSLLVVPGITNDVEAFMPRQLVTVNWTVVPTEIEDHYKLAIETVFETEVPFPNVVVENPFILPVVSAGLETRFDLVLRNEGLIRATNIQFVLPQNYYYDIVPLANTIHAIEAKTTVRVPMVVRYRGGPAGVSGKDLSNPPMCPPGVDTLLTCLPGLPLGLLYFTPCGRQLVAQYRNADLYPVCVENKTVQCLTDAAEMTGDLVVSKITQDLMGLGSACQAAMKLIECSGGNISPCLKSILEAICDGVPEGPLGLVGIIGGTLDCACKENPLNFVNDWLMRPVPPDPHNPSSGGGGPSTPIFVSGTAEGYGVPGGPINCRDPLLDDNFGEAAAATSAKSARPRANPAAGVCARVRLLIEQRATLTRTAFRGRLEIINGSDVSTLNNLTVDLDFRDESKTSVPERFFIQGPEQIGFTGDSAAQALGPQSTGLFEYTFIPTPEAAPDQPQVYRIGGILRYVEDGEQIVIPLLPAAITVYPDANLALKYFQQRDVYADDPFTKEVVEPSEPFSLGLLVQNTGHGAARNFRITSAQPKIIENEKGLLIDFKIIGSQVGSNEVAPSLQVNLGNIESGQSQVARWLFTSTLQGKFIEYSATFEHADSLGGKRTSLIDRTEIHELIHVVRDDRPGADGLMDFLVNDLPDPDNLPDTLYFSDGTMALVSAVTNGVADGSVTPSSRQIHVSASMAAGWCYLQMADPGPGYQLFRVVRSDGKVIRVADNAWTTDRTFPAAQTGARREHLFHLLDFDGTGSYTLYYRTDDSVPPTVVAIAEPRLVTAPVAALDVTFSEVIDLTTFDYQDLQLTRNNGANLITSAVTISPVSDTVYRISGLSALTGTDGSYALTVNATGVQDLSGNAGANSLTAQWAKGTSRPVPSAIEGVSGPQVNQPIGALEVVFSKPLNFASLDFSDFTLTRDGSSNLLDNTVTVVALTPTRLRVIGLTNLTAVGGHYVFTVAGGGVQDADGNSGDGTLSQEWTMVTAGPRISSLQTVRPDPRNFAVMAVEVSFAEPINRRTFDFRSLTLSRDGGPNLVSSAVRVDPINDRRFRINNLQGLLTTDGQYQLTVSAVAVQDIAGNLGSGSSNTLWAIDRTPPDQPANLRVTPDTGIAADDALVNVTSLRLSGTLSESNLFVTVQDELSGTYLGEISAPGLSFELPLEMDGPGSKRLRVQATDAANNVSEAGLLDVFVDQSPPVARLGSVTPNPRTTPVSQVTVFFSEPPNPATFDRSDLVLRRDGGPNLVNAQVQVQRLTSLNYLVTGLSALTVAPGQYELTVNTTTLEDLAGNAGLGSAQVTWQTIAPNQPPVLSPIADQSILLGQTLILTNRAVDPDVPPQVLTFSLPSGVPVGAILDPMTGVFAWTPSTAQVATTNLIVVRVADNGSPVLSDQISFTVTVRPAISAPVITTQPAHLTLAAGATATFAVRVQGTEPLSYQWEFNGTSLAGATNLNLTLPGVQPTQGGGYRVVVRNTLGSAVSDLAVLYVVPTNALPEWVVYDNSSNCLNAVWSGTNVFGDEVLLSPNRHGWLLNQVEIAYYLAPNASGNETLRVRLYANDGPELPGLLDATEPGTVLYDSGTGLPLAPGYHTVGLSNLQVVAPDRLTWTAQFAGVTSGETAGLVLYDPPSVGASYDDYWEGTAAGWELGSIPGRVANFGARITAQSAQPRPPVIVLQPQSQTAFVEETVALTVVASGFPVPAYQWQWNGTNLVDGLNVFGSTNVVLFLSALKPANAGAYTVIVTNAAGAVTSQVAVVTLTARPSDQAARLHLDWQPDGTIQMRVDGAAEERFDIEASTNLVDWVVLARMVANTPVDLEQFQPLWQQRLRGFFRAVVAQDQSDLPPTVTQQPLSLSARVGDAVVFAVRAAGSMPLSYQWRHNGAALSESARITGTTKASLFITSVQASDDGQYQAVVSNSAGTAASSNAILSVTAPPTITVQPRSQTVVAGSNVTFSVTASGVPAPAYQWRKDGTPIGGATSANYSITNVQATNAGVYSVVVSNVAGGLTSSNATLSINVPPSITVQPLSQTVVVGSNVTFSVTASGVPAPAYQWRKDGTPIGGATNASYFMANVQTTQGGLYSVMVSNVAGSVISSNATLSVNVPPSITAQPQSQTVVAGSNVTFSVTASGVPVPAYQWSKDGSSISGATNATYSIASAQTNHAGVYTVMITNLAGSKLSAAATLSVLPPGWLDLDVGSVGQPGWAGGNLSAFRLAGAGADIWTTADAFHFVYMPVTGDVSVVARVMDMGATHPFAKAGVMIREALTPGARHAMMMLTPTNGTQLIWRDSSNAAAQCIVGVDTLGVPYWIKLARSGSTFTTSKSSDGLTWGGSLTATVPMASNAYTGLAVTSHDTNVLCKAFFTSVEIPGYHQAPRIILQPSNKTVSTGTNVVLNVAATGAPGLSFQWLSNGISLAEGGRFSGVTTSNLVISGTQTNDTAQYSVVLSNVAGLVMSQVARLTVVQPPAITSQPQSLTVMASSNANFSVAASGTGPLSYQWLKDGVALTNAGRFSGVATATLSITGVQTNDMGSYSVLVSNAVASVPSASAVLTVNVAPSISAQPQSVVTNSGRVVFFSVVASGVPAPTYQWLKDGIALTNAGRFSGVTTANLTILSVQTNDMGSYSVLVSNVAGAVPSANATLTVNVRPSISMQPQSVTTNLGQTVTFGVVGSGLPAPAYQWCKEGVALANSGRVSGVAADTLTITGVQTNDGGAYTVVLTNVAGSFTSQVATLTVLISPGIITQPKGATNLAGSAVNLTVSASGSSLSYRWLFGGVAVSNNVTASTSSLWLTNLQPGQAGSYRVVISNSLGVVTSDVATVSVVVPTAPAVAGPLYVNLQASDLSAGSAVWGNQGSLGSFNAIGVPSRVTNVLATGLPGVMFSGTNAYGGPPAPADLTGGSDRSVEVWALNPSIGDEEGLVSWGHRGFGPQSFGISYGNNLVYGAVSDWLGNIGWGSADRVPAAGLWHHFVFTYNSNAVGTVYVDGAFVTNKLYTTPLNTFPAEAISIACQRDPDTNTLAMTFSGYINSVRIHGGALSAQQVATNYAFGPARLLTNGPMLSMAWIPAGTFTMGSPLTETNRYYWESPQTQVTLTRGFWIGKYEVTQPEYQAVTGSNPSANVGTNLPVDSVSWIQATNYCVVLTAAEQAAGRLPSGYVYRLPTGAEWEYACRAGRTNRFSYGDDFGFVQLPQYAWFSANSGYETHPVGSLLPNPWGLFDMYGNVNEWCWDWHATSYPGGSVTDPKGPANGSTRQIRGGDYSTDGPWCRSASRADASPSDGVSNVGFRVVLGTPL